MINLNFFDKSELELDENIFLGLVQKSEIILKKILENKLGSEKDGIVNLIICDDEEIRSYNRDYRKKDYATDVLSFVYFDDLSDREVIVGDIYISIDTAKIQAEEKNHSLEKELSILFCHGILHLMGFDHNNDREEEEMEKFASNILSL